MMTTEAAYIISILGYASIVGYFAWALHGVVNILEADRRMKARWDAAIEVLRKFAEPAKADK